MQNKHEAEAACPEKGIHLKSLKKRFGGAKLNIKFTALILGLTIIPIAVFAGILFYFFEQNVVNENTAYMEYTTNRSYDQIATNVDAINMSTQFFLSDTGLQRILLSEVSGRELSTEELLDFYVDGIAALERLVNNNPSLYQVRVYSSEDTIQEMMPILYTHARMNRLSWSQKEDYTGWQYQYTDTLFESYTRNQDMSLISLVTPMDDYMYGQIGVIEVAMTMETMFPSLYEDIESEWSCFVDSSGTVYSGAHEDISEELVAKILKEIGDERQTRTFYMKMQGKRLVISYLPLRELDGALISVDDVTQEINHVYQMRTVFIISMLLFLALLVVGVNGIVKHLLRKFYKILRSIREVQKGDLDVVIEDCGNDEMGELGSQINKMLERIKLLMADNLNRELLVKNSEIRALQNQINAHFIYNVLESIKMMAEIDEEYQISDAITSLGKLLRYSMKWVSGTVSVAEEVEYIRNYLALINLRFDYEITLALKIPDEIMQQQIPKMSLQPIVENAIYHGIEQLAEDTSIYIKGLKQGEDCVIEITDAGRGMSEEQVRELYQKISGEIEVSGGSGNGIGLKNVNDRLKICFGEKYGLEISSKLGCYTKVCVHMPLKRVKE